MRSERLFAPLVGAGWACNTQGYNKSSRRQDKSRGEPDPGTPTSGALTARPQCQSPKCGICPLTVCTGQQVRGKLPDVLRACAAAWCGTNGLVARGFTCRLHATSGP